VTAVAIEAVTRRFAGAAAAALDGVTLGIAAGERLTVLGPSGSGKTTLLRLVAGIDRPDSGDIRFDGASVLRVPAERRGAVLAFQDHLLFPHMSVAANAGFALRLRGLPAAEIAARAAAMLARVQLAGFGDRRPDGLSGGERARVALARALLAEPRVLLLDEPLASLDPDLRLAMRALVLDLQRETGVTTIIVTHDQEDAVAMGDRIALLIGGRLRQAGTADDLLRRPADAGVARFMGGLNFVPGRSAGGVFDGPLGRLALPAGAPEGPGLLTIRPEDVEPGDAGGNTVGVRVAARQFLGARTLVEMTAGGARITASLPPRMAEALVPGATSRVSLPRAALWVLPPDGGGG